MIAPIAARIRLSSVVVLLALLLAPGCRVQDAEDVQELGVPSGFSATQSADRPNIVVLVVDDLRWDEFGAAGHPYLETPNIDRLANEGALFVNSIHAVSLCSPNRASILTGQYPSRHGIIDNVGRSLASHLLPTFPRALQESGYATAFLGKWHMGNDATPRPGFDYWSALPGQGRSVDPEIFEDGELHVVEGYTSDILTERALSVIDSERERPFFIYLAHKAVHPDLTQLDDGSVAPGSSQGYVPAPRHLGRYDGEIFPRRPNTITTLADLEDKPAVRRALAIRATGSPEGPLENIPAPTTNEVTIRRRAEMVLAVDDGIGRILERLEELGELDRTMIVFTSDNGFFYDEHGLTSERRLPYEESIRNPLIIRYPPAAPPGSRPTQLAVTVDIAPTVLDAAGVSIGDHVQGRSLIPVLRGEAEGWREAALTEFYTYENPFQHLAEMDYRAVRTERYKYIHWIKFPELDELYDLQADPYELENLADDPAMAEVRTELRAELGRLSLFALGLAEDP